MKRTLPIMILILLMQVMHAEEGTYYIGVSKATHKVYAVSQKHGKNSMRLDTEASCFYDAEGNIVEKYILQGNRSYKGKVLINIRKDPPTREILNFNHMNLLASRSVEYSDPETLESTFIEYDAKGKILRKISTRVSAADPDIWELNYNQVGYAATYNRVSRADGTTITQKKVYDFKDDLLETHHYSYDDQGLLIEIAAYNPADSLVFRKDYKYDEHGNQIEENTYDGENQITESIVSFYNESMRLIQKSEYIWNPRFGRIPNLRKQTEISYH